MVQCYLWDGHRERARLEYDTLRQLTPEARRSSLARWFDEEQRRAAR